MAKQSQKEKSEARAKKFIRLCLVKGLPIPKREFKFHPTRKWRIDFFFQANNRKVALEVEGGVWTKGRHTRGKGFLGDVEKYNEMSRNGIFLLRTTPSGLLSVDTLNLVLETLYGGQ